MGSLRILTKEKEIKIMEVCGTHSEVISKFAIRQLYKERVKLISGPGCPVCVIPPQDIDLVVEYAKNGFRVITFGDLLRIPGTTSSLLIERARGKSVESVYSPLDALVAAKESPSKQVVFIAVGFETTAPLVALTIMKAKQYGLKNFSVICLLRTMPNILRSLFKNNIQINGLLLPGHVCTVTGSKPFEFLADEFGITGVVSGFNPEDVIQSIETIIKNIHKPSINIQYQIVVTADGNRVAQNIIQQVFEPCDVSWRGFGLVKDSGLAIKQEWGFFDALKRWGIEIKCKQNEEILENICCCGDIMQGLFTPMECPLFKISCKPESPKGPCMVSSEGSCSIFYNYGG
jgi:hydrogenase expression/formation protein HypD